MIAGSGPGWPATAHRAAGVLRETASPERMCILWGPDRAAAERAACVPAGALAEVRYPLARLPAMLITGRDAVYLPAGAGGGTDRVVRDVAAVSVLIDFFDCQWEAARPDDARPPRAEVEVLRLLAAGVKHEVIARQLGLSPRTVGRRIDDAYDRLEAVSAFQAGYQAARRGWI